MYQSYDPMYKQRSIVTTRKRKRSKSNDEEWIIDPYLSEHVLSVCCGISGCVLAPLTIYWILLWMSWGGVFQLSCPTVHGRVCNTPRGTCATGGVCECVHPLFSGPTCSDTACPAYDAVEDTMCNGRGECNPLVWIPDDSPCRELGWAAEVCSQHISSLPALSPERPRCMCTIPFRGDECQESGCPSDTTHRICSGNGNPEVLYTTNKTGSTTGQGCQCGNIQNIRYEK